MTPPAREVALLLGVLVVQVAGPHAGGGGEAGATAGGIATAAALGQTALLLRRGRQPLLVVTGVLVLYAVQVAAVDVVPPVALWVALWALAGARSQGLTVGLASAAVAVLLAGEALHEGGGLGVVLSGLTVAVVLAALLRRSERGRLDAVRAEATIGERLRIARDLHDLAGHGLGVVAVQSSTARVALEAGDIATARAALKTVESSSRSALHEMRQMLGVLTDTGTAPAPGLPDLPALVDNLRGSGITVTARLDSPDVSPSTSLAAYRVAQEALTNAVKHGQHSVELDVSADSRLRVSVVSRGPLDPQPGGGTGLDGLRSRVAALGGTTEIGPTDDGWSVVAELPLEAS